MRTKSTIRFAEVIGGGLDFRPPPIGSLGDMPPRPHYIILYDYTFRAKVIGGGVILIFAPPPIRTFGGGGHDPPFSMVTFFF